MCPAIIHDIVYTYLLGLITVQGVGEGRNTLIGYSWWGEGEFSGML